LRACCDVHMHTCRLAGAAAGHGTAAPGQGVCDDPVRDVPAEVGIYRDDLL